MFIARRAVGDRRTGEPMGLKIDRVPSRSDRDFTIDAASRWAGLPADPAERDPPRREEALLLPTTWRSRYRPVIAIRAYAEGAAMGRPDAPAARSRRPYRSASTLPGHRSSAG